MAASGTGLTMGGRSVVDSDSHFEGINNETIYKTFFFCICVCFYVYVFVCLYISMSVRARPIISIIRIGVSAFLGKLVLL